MGSLQISILSPGPPTSPPSHLLRSYSHGIRINPARLLEYNYNINIPLNLRKSLFHVGIPALLQNHSLHGNRVEQNAGK